MRNTTKLKQLVEYASTLVVLARRKCVLQQMPSKVATCEVVHVMYLYYVVVAVCQQMMFVVYYRSIYVYIYIWVCGRVGV